MPRSIGPTRRYSSPGSVLSAPTILTTDKATLDKLAAALVERETLDTPELMEIIGKLPQWPSANGNGNGKTNRRAATGDRRRVSRPATKA